MQALLSAGADPNRRDAAGDTPTSVAEALGEALASVVDLLAEYGAVLPPAPELLVAAVASPAVEPGMERGAVLPPAPEHLVAAVASPAEEPGMEGGAPTPSMEPQVLSPATEMAGGAFPSPGGL